MANVAPLSRPRTLPALQTTATSNIASSLEHIGSATMLAAAKASALGSTVEKIPVFAVVHNRFVVSFYPTNESQYSFSPSSHSVLVKPMSF